MFGHDNLVQSARKSGRTGRFALLGLAAGAAMAFAAPANAVITTFASYGEIGAHPADDMRWVKSAVGTGGELCATTTANCAHPGSVAVQFDFLQATLASLGHLSAALTFDATAPNGHPAQTFAGFLFQPDIAGTFKFTYTGLAPLHVGSHTYLPGSNLLTATVFTNADFFGAKNSTSGSLSADTQTGSTLVYTSDFLDFSSTANRDFAFNLTGISPALGALSGKALTSFDGVSGGSFSSERAPIVIPSVPEPATWALMLTGFFGAGVALRRRRAAVAA